MATNCLVCFAIDATDSFLAIGSMVTGTSGLSMKVFLREKLEIETYRDEFETRMCMECGERVNNLDKMLVQSRELASELHKEYERSLKEYLRLLSINTVDDSAHEPVFPMIGPKKSDAQEEHTKAEPTLIDQQMEESKKKKIHCNKDPGNFFNCSICRQRFSEEDKLGSHYRKYHGGTAIRNPNTDDVLDIVDDLQPLNAIQKERDLRGTEPDNICENGISKTKKKLPGRNFECKMCGFMFLYNSHLKRHMKIHNRGTEKPFSCGVCERRFHEEDNLKMHFEKFHRESKSADGSSKKLSYSCSECEFSEFRTKSEYSSHMLQTHQKAAKLFKCAECGKCYTRRNHLNVHMRRHTGEAPYQCDLCGKRFTHSSSLTSHKHMHYDIRLVKCHICGLEMRCQSNLNKHILLHNAEKTIPCSACDRKFATQTYLKLHWSNVHAEKILDCLMCDKKFSSKIRMKEHMKCIHKVVQPKAGRVRRKAPKL